AGAEATAPADPHAGRVRRVLWRGVLAIGIGARLLVVGTMVTTSARESEGSALMSDYVRVAGQNDARQANALMTPAAQRPRRTQRRRALRVRVRGRGAATAGELRCDGPVRVWEGSGADGWPRLQLRRGADLC